MRSVALYHVDLPDGTAVAPWRARARALLLADIAPEHVTWGPEAAAELFDTASVPQVPASVALTVPRGFLEIASDALAHHDPQRYGVLYRILWRLTHGEPQLLQLITDADMLRARAWQKAVHRDLHKMKAFVRFRQVGQAAADPVYVAWFEPEHYIVERGAPFFVRRYASMSWSILTPYACAHWDTQTLRFGGGAARTEAPTDDALEDLWRDYYASIFNPARLKVDAMQREMPKRYWKNLPEARLIPGLIAGAQQRTETMVDAAPTTPRKRIGKPAPPNTAAAPLDATSLATLSVQARDCRRCELWRPATQTVWGEGPADARVMLIGEQPGDQEDLSGRPFVGPAGQLLDRALLEAGLDRRTLYVTNTVKHFKFEPRGKRRLHKRAGTPEQQACRPWLEAELASVDPRIVVCLGSMAANALFGSSFRLLKERGQWRDLPGYRRAFATVHPSYLLRLPDEQARAAGYAQFVQDLQLIAAGTR